MAEWQNGRFRSDGAGTVVSLSGATAALVLWCCRDWLSEPRSLEHTRLGEESQKQRRPFRAMPSERWCARAVLQLQLTTKACSGEPGESAALED